ncbi:hypothetical protein D3D02_16940 [Halobellus sp. Atlit-38R]|uniref:DUF7344 domain-containing protein n=1 Tax=Halobellus sp. Atlit-38R TaxID=2282131 RepID=UPI000EF1F815|nr:helix-turn-helix domain-containing protein [Halobellus sp. Atlit-38R]RLM83688.1 hypothetical protein D3D02_16940 [Halobellus sp. Atlit-38R]
MSQDRDPPRQRGIATDDIDEDDILAYLQETDRTVTIEALAHRTGLQRTEVRVLLEHLAANDAVEITPRLHEVVVSATTSSTARPDGGTIGRLTADVHLDLTLAELLDAISAERRRATIHVLASLDEDTHHLSVADLATRVADTTEEPIRDAVYATLKNNHVPRLADNGLVDYRPIGRGSTVAPTDRTDDVAIVLESLESVVDEPAEGDRV